MTFVIFDNLASGLTLEEIMADYPPLTLEDVRSAIADNILDNKIWRIQQTFV